jgi:enoyl-CoA hydratase
VIVAEDRDAVRLLRLEHGKANAMDIELLDELRASFARLSSETNSRAVVVTGTGTMFSAGLDLRRLLDGGRDYVARLVPAMEACFLEVFGCDLPVVAALNGHAIAGGCVLAAACDVRLMSSDGGRIGVPEHKVGVPFPAGVLEVLRFSLPPQRASELLLRGELHDPPAALAKGLVDELAPGGSLLDRALAVAGELAAVPPASFATTKRRLRAAAREQATRLSRESCAATVELWCSAPVQSAVRRFVEQTLPRR